MGRFFDTVRDQLESWGLALPRAKAGATGPRVYVSGPGEGSQMRRIGTLWQEGADFCFRYDDAFVALPNAEPISAFPDLHQEYRSRDLWPFFSIRIPPAARSDVHEAMDRLGLRPDQTLEVLGKLAKRSISNPYRLDLAGTH
jgi:HipA-like protein